MSSASLMVNMPATSQAVALARLHPQLCLSLHVNTVHGHCIAAPSQVASIVNEKGMFYKSSEYCPDGHVKTEGKNQEGTMADFKTEIIAQLNHFHQLLGYYPIHMEGHSLTIPTFLAALAEVGDQYGIHVMSFEKRHQKGFKDVNYPFFDVNNHDIALYNRYGMTVESMLTILKQMDESGDDIAAIHCHPGWIDETVMESTSLIWPRCRDAATLCDKRVKEWINSKSIEIIGYDYLKN